MTLLLLLCQKKIILKKDLLPIEWVLKAETRKELSYGFCV